MASKRGQSAMEFLMTYGWAILIILVVLTILFVLGVFSPSNVGNSCDLPAGFSCYTFKIAENGQLSLDLGHSTASHIVVTGIACDERDPPGEWKVLNKRINIGTHSMITESGDVVCYKEDGTTAEMGERYKGKLYINYSEAVTEIPHTIKGGVIYTIRDPPDPITPICSPNCPNGEGCVANANCASKYCDPATKTCQPEPPPACSPGCGNDEGCVSDADCTSGYCDPATKTCQDEPPPACSPDCPNDEECVSDDDCASGWCDPLDNTCQTCASDCPDGADCTDHTQCTGGYCDPATQTCGTAPSSTAITSCGYISTAGDYVIDPSFVVNTLVSCGGSTACICIDSDNVKLDGNNVLMTGAGSGVGIRLDYSNFCEVKKAHVEGFHTGIYLSSSSNNNNVTGNTANSNTGGITLANSSNNNVMGNTANSNSNNGIFLSSTSENNNVADNTANSNGNFGITLLSSSNNNVTGNTASSNVNDGIYLSSQASDNNVTGNTVSSNIRYGIYLYFSSNNNVTGNTITLNDMHGIRVTESTGILFENNNICDNNQSGGAYYDLYCGASSAGSGSSVFGTRSGCAAVTRTDGCPNGAGCNEDAGCASGHCDPATNTCQDAPAGTVISTCTAITVPGNYVISPSFTVGTLVPCYATGYSACICVEGVNDVSLNCDGVLMTGPGTLKTYGIMVHSSDNFQLSNCNFQNFNQGAWFYQSVAPQITNNHFDNNVYLSGWSGDGILVDYCNGAVISGNTANGNTGSFGMQIRQSSGVTISDNIVSSSQACNGIAMRYLTNPVITGNTANTNGRVGCCGDGIIIGLGITNAQMSENTAQNNCRYGYMFESSASETQITSGTACYNTASDVQCASAGNIAAGSTATYTTGSCTNLAQSSACP